MDTYQKLRELKLYSLAAYYKIRQKFESDVPLNRCEEYLIARGPMQVSLMALDRAIKRYFDSNQLDATHNLDYQTLSILNSRMKFWLKNPAGWRFISNWHWHKELINGPRIAEARSWFERIARMNPSNEWGKYAAKYVWLIDRRLDNTQTLE